MPPHCLTNSIELGPVELVAYTMPGTDKLTIVVNHSGRCRGRLILSGAFAEQPGTLQPTDYAIDLSGPSS